MKTNTREIEKNGQGYIFANPGLANDSSRFQNFIDPSKKKGYKDRGKYQHPLLRSSAAVLKSLGRTFEPLNRFPTAQPTKEQSSVNSRFNDAKIKDKLLNLQRAKV
jgi:hypothetical protein